MLIKAVVGKIDGFKYTTSNNLDITCSDTYSYIGRLGFATGKNYWDGRNEFYLNA